MHADIVLFEFISLAAQAHSNLSLLQGETNGIGADAQQTAVSGGAFPRAITVDMGPESYFNSTRI